MGWAEPHHYQQRACTVVNLIARLREHQSPGLQEEDLTTLCNIAAGKEVDNDGVLGCKQRMAAQGAIESIVHVLWAQISCVAVQEKGFMVLLHLTLGDGSCIYEDNVEARKLHMVEAAALDTITAGMRLHENSAAVQLLGLAALGSITMVNGSDDTRAYVMRRLEAAGAIEATVAALQAHATSVEIHERGFGLLCDMSSGDDGLIVDQLHKMVEAVYPSPTLPRFRAQQCPIRSRLNTWPSRLPRLDAWLSRLSPLLARRPRSLPRVSAGRHRGGH